MFQFTRPQGARRGTKIKAMMSWVSIHAPTRGATLHGNTVRYSRIQFQFTRPQGARLANSRIASLFDIGFNSRAHKGRD